ncbi:MAG: molybdenum cofactor biosynthesis protein MoaE [Rhodospirillales bacterium]|nr:molybdenum cofactor biosynthesis protein MoaE [Rhodospirillales bacterium]
MAGAVVRIGAADFEPGAELRSLSERTEGAGGLGCFIGIVRGEAAGRPIAAMTLEHYPGMTERAVRAIAEEAQNRWHLLGTTVIHRVGRLTPGERIVLVMAAALHRGPALEATSFLIDWLKTKAPFWKKEHFTDGAEAWVAARASDEAAATRW